MLRVLTRVSALMGCLVSVAVPSAAQEVVHALTGTVSSIDAAARTITVFQDNGTQGVYGVMSDPKTHLAFDKKVSAGTTAAAEFKQSGAYVIVFYFGSNRNPTVAAFKSLGAGPFTSTVGKIDKFDTHDHTILVEDSTGKTQTYRIDANTIAETSFGVQEGLKARIQPGDQVRVVSAASDGSQTALFLREM